MFNTIPNIGEENNILLIGQHELQLPERSYVHTLKALCTMYCSNARVKEN